MTQNSSDLHKAKGHKHSQDRITFFPLMCSHYESISSFQRPRSLGMHMIGIFETREDCYFTLLHRILLLWLN